MAGLSIGSSLAGPVTRDAGDLPVCIADPANAHDGVVLVWDENQRYGRDLYAFRLSEGQSYDATVDSCQTWQKFSGGLKRDSAWVEHKWAPVLAPTASEYKGVSFDREVVADMNRIRQGMNVKLVDPVRFLAQHPIAHFTVDINRDFTKQFGVGATGELYRAYLDSQPRNHAFREQISSNLIKSMNHQLAPLSQRLAGYKVLIAEGYMQSALNDRLGPLKAELNENSVRWEDSTYDTLGGVQANADDFRDQLMKLLNQGENVIVTGGSKGIPAAMTAVADITYLIQSGQYHPRGRIAAFINLSGMVQGSFLVDWAARFPLDLIADYKLREVAASVGLNMTGDLGFHDMRTKVLNPLAERNSKMLPQNIPYFNLVGVMGGNGLARDSQIFELQKSLTIPRLPEHGANDGYIEYPGTQIPDAWVRDNYTTWIDASHVVLDGKFNNFELKDKIPRSLVIAAVFHTVADHLSSKH